MMYLARIAPLGVGGVFPEQPDGSKVGWLRVIYKGERRWARPCYAFGRFHPPTEHWIRKYNDRWGVWVSPMLSPYGEELEDNLVYLGFCPFGGGVQADVTDAFPEKKLLFSEKWELVVNETAAEPSVMLRYVGDALNIPTSPADPGAEIIKISQKPGDERIHVEHIVTGAPLAPQPTNLDVDEEGNVVINVTKNVTTVVGTDAAPGNVDTAIHGDVTLAVGTDAVPHNVTATVKGTTEYTGKGKATVTLMDELVAEVAKKVMATLADELVVQVAKKVGLTLADELEATITKKVCLSVAAEVAASVATKFDVQVDGQPSLKVEGGKATVGTGAESGVIFSALSSAWSTVMGSIAGHTHTLGSTVGNLGYPVGGSTDPSAAISTIATAPPIALAECQKLKIPATGP